MPKVEVIHAQKQPEKEKTIEKYRTAAYCRVSTDSEEQEGSYEAQVRHYTNYISANADWELAGIYADEGISGTQVNRRKEFSRMIEDCKAGKIDLIVTKSISRFARNTVDCIRYIRELKSLGIPIIFEKEHINTMDEKGELIITIMASIAQEESQSISQNVRMGIRYRMQQGKGRVNTSVLLGLDRGEDGKLCPVPGEADTVRAIFRAFVDGENPNQIARGLERRGIPTPTKGIHWFPSTVYRILRNEKYCGDLLLQKYYVKDFLTHQTIRNNGSLPMYYVANAHDPVVPRGVFEEAQGELLRRSLSHHEPGQMRGDSEEPLNRRLVCARCGRFLRKCTLPTGEVQWECRLRTKIKRKSHYEPERKCSLRHLPEPQAKEAILRAFSKLPEYLEPWILPRLADAEKKRRAYDEETEKLKKKEEDSPLPEGTVSLWTEKYKTKDDPRIFQRAELTRKLLDLKALRDLAEEIKAHQEAASTVILSEAKDLLSNAEPEPKALPAACHDYEDFYNRTKMHLPEEMFTDGKITSFDDTLIIRCLDHAVVSDRTLTARFKTGLVIKVKR